MPEKDVCISTLVELHQLFLTSADVSMCLGDWEKARCELCKSREVVHVLRYVDELIK